MIDPNFLLLTNEIVKNIAGAILIFWGYFDGVKYHLQAKAVRKAKSARGNSRMFTNLAIGNDVYRLFYFFFIDRNFYVLLTSIIALIFMLELWYVQYKFYPYKYRGLSSFKRPNIILYIINSWLPNSIRKHL